MAIEHIQKTELLDEITWRRILTEQIASEFEANSRRRWRRYPANGELKVEFEIDGEPRRRTWDIIQISAGGLTVRSEEDIPEDTPLMLKINFDGNPIPAKGLSRHCTQTLGGYKLGIKLMFATRGSPE